MTKENSNWIWAANQSVHLSK